MPVNAASRARPKAERFLSSQTGRTCLFPSFPALRTGLLSLSPSGTSPHRTIPALILTQMGALGNAKLLSNLAVVDALLGKKDDAIAEARRATEMLPVSKDAVDGPGLLMNLAAVYAWTGESDHAFEQLETLVKIPNGLYYGNLKLDPYWEPLRNDPRFAKLTAELAPKD